MTKYYNIHDMVELEWRKPLWSFVPDYAIKYHYFQTESPANKAPVTITISSGKPPAELCKGLRTVAERFAMGDHLWEIRHQHGRMRWSSWIRGLDTDRVEIWYDFPLHNRLQWPWPCFPDHIICFHVVEPVVEYKLEQQGAAILHAGAVARNGEALLLSGRGGVKKTTYIMDFLKNGWEYLADDLVLLKEGKLYAYPMTDTFFDYFYLRESDETIDLKAMIGALRHVRKGAPISFAVAPPTRVAKVCLLIGSTGQTREALRGIVDVNAIEKITAVDRLERLNFVDEEEAMGRFHLHLNQVCGNDSWNEFWNGHRQLLSRSLSGLPYQEIISGRAVNLELLR